MNQIIVFINRPAKGGVKTESRTREFRASDNSLIVLRGEELYNEQPPGYATVTICTIRVI